MKYISFFDKKSSLIQPRNPLKKDQSLIDYDMSSEEEWNEQNGEDLEGKQNDEDEESEEEKMLIDLEEPAPAGFIVPDDYLSASEINLSQSSMNSQQKRELVEERKRNLPANKNNIQTVQNMQIYVIQFDKVGNDKKNINYMEEFKAVAFRNKRKFPIRVSEGKNENGNGNENLEKSK